MTIRPNTTSAAVLSAVTLLACLLLSGIESPCAADDRNDEMSRRIITLAHDRLRKEAETAEFKAQFEHAIERRQQVHLFAMAVYGLKHWKTRDAEVRLQYARQLAALSDEKATLHQAMCGKLLEFYSLVGEEKHEEAIAVGTRVRGECAEVVGRNTPDYVSIGLLLGNALRRRHRYEEAHEVLGQSATAAKRLYGASHGDYWDAVSLRAQSLYALGRLQEQETILESVLSQADGALEAQTRAFAQWSYGCTLLRTDRPIEALEAFRSVLEVAKSEPGGGRSSQAAALLHIGWVYHDLGELDRAEEHLLKGMGILESLKDKDADRNMWAYGCVALGTVRLANGDLDQAKAYVLKGLEVLRAENEDGPHTALARVRLAAVLARQQDSPGAEENLKAAVEVLEKTYGIQHPDARDALKRAVRIYREIGSETKAIALEAELR